MCAHALGYYSQNQGYGDPNGMPSMPNVAQQPRWEEQEPNLVASMSGLALQPSPKISEYFSKSQPYANDLNENTFNFQCDEYLSGLQLSPAEIASLQQQTVGQWENPDWMMARRKRLTASNFGEVFHLRDTTYRSRLVKKMLFSTLNSSSSIAMDYGRDHEPIAIAAYEDSREINVLPCGLFVHPKYGYLGASPDGLIGRNGILEVKCPFFARDLNPWAIRNPRFYCTISNDGNYLRLKPNDNIYYQIQGQLEVTGRKWCDFVVWTRLGFSVERICRDESVWDDMFPALEEFYEGSLLPELVDSRHERGLPIREPNFVLEANGII